MKKIKFQYLFGIILSILFLGLYSDGGNEIKTNRTVSSDSKYLLMQIILIHLSGTPEYLIRI